MDIRPPHVLAQRKHSEILWLGGKDIFQYGILISLRDGYSFVYAQTSVFDAHVVPVGDVRTDILELFLVISDDTASDFLQNGVVSFEYGL